MPRSTTPLRDLINQAARKGLPYKKGAPSLHTLADAAIDPVTGTKVSLNYLGQISRGETDRIPMPAHLGAIGAGLAATLGEEYDAADAYELVRLAAIIEWMPPRDPHIKAVLEGEFEAQVGKWTQALGNLAIASAAEVAPHTSRVRSA